MKVRIERDQLDAIDAWRMDQADCPNRPEAIRRLVTKGLNAAN